MVTLRTVTRLIIFTAIIGLTASCREKLVAKTPDYTEYGWELWMEQDYRGAISQFEAGLAIDETYADTWNGLGWSYIELGAPDSANTNFIPGVALADTSEVATELLAGRAFARLASGSYAAAVVDAKAALAATALWIFSRNSSLTYEDLTLTVATGYYGTAEFDSSLVWVKKLDATYSTDVTKAAGRSDLAAKLQALAEGS